MELQCLENDGRRGVPWQIHAFVIFVDLYIDFMIGHAWYYSIVFKSLCSIVYEVFQIYLYV